MELSNNFSLKKYNTFGIEVFAQSFVSVKTQQELVVVLDENKNKKILVLGGGSNMLLTKNVDSLVIHIGLKGKKIITETEDFAWVSCQAGENWHEFVLWTLENDFGGLENMSLIPGNVGTTPIQNIGAYGTEIKDTMISCDAIEIVNGTLKTFTNEECKFGYRESIFKDEVKNKFIITSVVFKLTKKHHVINTSYGDINRELERNSITQPTIKDVSNAVIAIRKLKLPDPKELGNSGSFFKNPIITKKQVAKIKETFPDLPFYSLDDDLVKVPAGWLIENADFKGKRFGDAGVHKNQALVLVNYGNASGQELLDLSKTIQEKIFNKYGIWIETEVNIV